ncbi:unnamed protein product [Macrosiphum euphorbiae]|uniref:Uncharacterized protein n=1 Tax=Macrosiphum euphorbiae TaxID=13131 RepID=A0AAV0VX78_9HEMI|nr:unnamed protein product [Macrosiphum euphorbiae]
MSYNKWKLRKENNKGFNSSQRKDCEVMINAERSSSQLVWIPRNSNISKINNNIDTSSRTSTKYDETPDNLNHNSLETNKTYTIINITFNGSSKEIVPFSTLAEARQDRPQKTIITKENDCYLKKSKYNTDDCSLAIRNEQDVMSVTDQCSKLLDDCSLKDRIEDVIQKEKDYEFDIFFINDQHQLDVKKIKI